MEFSGLTSVSELIGHNVGVLITPASAQVDAITASVYIENGVAFIDCIPTLPRKYVAPVPDKAVIAKAQDSRAPWPFAILIPQETEAALLIAKLRREELRFRN